MLKKWHIFRKKDKYNREAKVLRYRAMKKEKKIVKIAKRKNNSKKGYKVQ